MEAPALQEASFRSLRRETPQIVGVEETPVVLGPEAIKMVERLPQSGGEGKTKS